MTIVTNDPDQPEVSIPVLAFVEHGVDPNSAVPLEETLFGQTRCARCHADPAGELTGAQLYTAVCEMCHGQLGDWALAVPPARRTRQELYRWTAEGQDGTSMPGYLQANGGPLTAEQVDSLVNLVVGVEQ